MPCVTRTCSCTPGYTCKGYCTIIDAQAKNGEKKRAYASNWNCTSCKSISTMMAKRMDLVEITKSLAAESCNSSPCCSRTCMSNLVEEHGIKKLSEAVLAARKTVYHTNQNMARDELKNILLKSINKTEILTNHGFFHHGKLDCPDGIQVILIDLIYTAIRLFKYFFPL